jgi:hypothetical protein
VACKFLAGGSHFFGAGTWERVRRVEGGGWRVEGGGWRVEGGGWRVKREEKGERSVRVKKITLPVGVDSNLQRTDSIKIGAPLTMDLGLTQKPVEK